MTQKPPEFDPHPVVPQPVLEGPLAALLEWQAMAEGAYSANTLRAQKADGAIFQAFCESRGEPYLPAAPKTIRAFIEDRVKAGKKPATIKRYVATISRVHMAARLSNPCSSEAARLGLKKWGERPRRARSRLTHWGGRTSKNLSRAQAKGCEPIASAPCSASLMKLSRAAASSWLSRSETLISIRTAPARR
jgi:hypothetical protein